MIYIPSPPVINNGKTIFDYPELIEFIKQVDVTIDKRGKKNYGTIFNLLMEYIRRD